MHGFFGSYKAKVIWDLSSFDDKCFVKRSYGKNDFQLAQVTLPKFLNDKYFAEIDGCFLATEGVLFEADKPEEAIARYRNGETTFWNSWRGSFAGVLYDRKTDTLIVFNDHIGSKMLFYAQTKDGFVFASDSYILAHALGLDANNESFFWQLLLYGYSPVGDTAFEGIHRLLAGEYVIIKNISVKRCIYHRFDNTPNNLSINENIERIDAAFRKAVERAIRKNEEYGYSHFLPLSAGLDSRMTNRVAHDMANSPIHNITYSQTGFYDETIPRELARYWRNVMHFTPLDGGDCLIMLDETSRLTCGLVHYSGAAETLYGLPQAAKEEGGAFLTGMVGEIILGTAFTQKDQRQAYNMSEAALLHNYNKHIRRFTPFNAEHIYPNREVFYLYVRAFNCADLGSPLIHQQYGESYSPFCDVDVLETAWRASIEQRWNNRLYDQWILSKYPDMVQWKHNGKYTIGQRPKQVRCFGRTMSWNDIPRRAMWYILKKLHVHDFSRQTLGHSMNPEDDWFAQNKKLRTWYEEYIQSYMGLLEKFPQVRRMAEILSEGNATDRMQVLSLLACLRQAR